MRSVRPIVRSTGALIALTAGIGAASIHAVTSAGSAMKTKASSTRVFDFANGTTEGWSVDYGPAQIATTTLVAFHGASHSLAVTLTGAGNPGLRSPSSLKGIQPGSFVTYHVHEDSGVALNVEPYVVDLKWKAHFIGTFQLSAGRWKTIRVKVPSVSRGVRYVGIEIENGRGVRTTLALGDIRIVGAVRTLAAKPRKTTTASTSPPTTSAPGPVGSSSSRHVMVLMMENQSYSDVIGSGSAPFQTALSKSYEAVTSSYGIGHYSLDNYLGLISGQFFSWSTGDCSPGGFCQSAAPTFVGQLDASHTSWAAFMGGMPRNCDQTDAASYGVRHDPFVYFPALVSADCSKIEPLGALIGALSNSSPPSFVFVSPSICDDAGGDQGCATISAGDAFLAAEIPAIQQTPWYQSGGVIVLTYDEGDGSGQGPGEYLTGQGNHVPTIVISAATKGAAPDSRYVNEFGVLASLEKTYGEPCLPEACSGSNGVLPIP